MPSGCWRSIKITWKIQKYLHCRGDFSFLVFYSHHCDSTTKICMSLTHTPAWLLTQLHFLVTKREMKNLIMSDEMSPSPDPGIIFLSSLLVFLSAAVLLHFLDLVVLSLLPRQRTATPKVSSLSERWCTAGVITVFPNGIFKEVVGYCSWMCMYLKN